MAPLQQPIWRICSDSEYDKAVLSALEKAVNANKNEV
jgi:hypothetical protein